MKKLFTVEFHKTEELVEIHLNEKGIDNLIKILQQLQKSNQNNHSHLMTEDWGGNELSNEIQNEDNEMQLIKHLKIQFWK